LTDELSLLRCNDHQEAIEENQARLHDILLPSLSLYYLMNEPVRPLGRGNTKAGELLNDLDPVLLLSISVLDKRYFSAFLPILLDIIRGFWNGYAK
jgi:hypothetical protein